MSDYTPGDHDGQFSTAAEWRRAGSPRPYTYHGPRERNDYVLQLAVVGIGVMAVWLLDAILSISDLHLYVFVARALDGNPWYAAAAVAAGVGTAFGTWLFWERPLRRPLRRTAWWLRRAAKKSLAVFRGSSKKRKKQARPET